MISAAYEILCCCGSSKNFGLQVSQTAYVRWKVSTFSVTSTAIPFLCHQHKNQSSHNGLICLPNPYRQVPGCLVVPQNKLGSLLHSSFCSVVLSAWYTLLSSMLTEPLLKVIVSIRPTLSSIFKMSVTLQMPAPLLDLFFFLPHCLSSSKVYALLI